MRVTRKYSKDTPMLSCWSVKARAGTLCVESSTFEVVIDSTPNIYQPATARGIGMPEFAFLSPRLVFDGEQVFVTRGEFPLETSREYDGSSSTTPRRCRIKSPPPCRRLGRAPVDEGALFVGEPILEAPNLVPTHQRRRFMTLITVPVEREDDRQSSESNQVGSWKYVAPGFFGPLAST